MSEATVSVSIGYSQCHYKLQSVSLQATVSVSASYSQMSQAAVGVSASYCACYSQRKYLFSKIWWYERASLKVKGKGKSARQ